MGQVARELTLQIRGLGLSALLTPISREGEGLKAEWIRNGQWFHQSCLCNKPPLKTQNDRVQRAARLLNTRTILEGGMSGEDMPSSEPLFIWVFICVLYNKWINVSKVFPRVLWSLPNQDLRRASYGPWFTSAWSEAQTTAWGLGLASEVGAALCHRLPSWCPLESYLMCVCFNPRTHLVFQKCFMLCWMWE